MDPSSSLPPLCLPNETISGQDGRADGRDLRLLKESLCHVTIIFALPFQNGILLNQLAAPLSDPCLSLPVYQRMAPGSTGIDLSLTRPYFTVPVSWFR